MKIGTDSVLLGAWTPCESETRILDIGTGSGILALMMAQRNNKAFIDAIEIDIEASNLAVQNMAISPWADRITILNSSFQEFASNTKNKYSLIICNPPFFSNSLKASGKSRTMARHNDSLPVDELLYGVSCLLENKGKASFIFPYDAFDSWKTEAEKYLLFPVKVTFVRSSIRHEAHRVMAVFAKGIKKDVLNNTFYIYDSNRIHTNEYQELTKEFYLKF